jgi:hypothetical protein
MSILVGRHALEEALKDLVTFVDVLINANVNISTAHAPVFSYLLSPKQRDDLKKICEMHGWPLPKIFAIEINVPAIAHIIRARLEKDHVTVEFVGEILAAAYSDHARILVNRDHGEQALFLNTPKKLKLNGTVWHAVAIIAIDGKDGKGERRMESRTAYHATEAKARGIEKAAKKAAFLTKG